MTLPQDIYLYYLPLTHAWAYFLLALLVIIEGPVATLVAAVTTSTGYLSPVAVFFSAATGNLLSDIIWYYLGYLGKMDTLEKLGKFVGLKYSQVEKLEQTIQHDAPKLLLIAKLTLSFSIPVLVATGMARIPVRRWLPILLFGETLWTGTLVILGVYLGKYLTSLRLGLQIFMLISALIFLAIVIRMLFQKRQDPDSLEK